MTFKSDASNPSSSVTLLEIYFVFMFPPDDAVSPTMFATAGVPLVPENGEEIVTVGVVKYPEPARTGTTFETEPLTNLPSKDEKLFA